MAAFKPKANHHVFRISQPDGMFALQLTEQLKRKKSSCNIKWDVRNEQQDSPHDKSKVIFQSQVESFHPRLAPLINRYSLLHGSLHHGQVFERMASALLGFISWPEELDLSLLGFDFVLVFLEFLLGCDVWVSHRLEK